VSERSFAFGAGGEVLESEKASAMYA